MEMPTIATSQTSGIVHRGRFGQTEHRRILLFGRQCLFDQPRAVARKLVIKTDRLDLVQVGQRYGNRRGYQRDIKRKSKRFTRTFLLTGVVVTQSDDQHHHAKNKWVEIFVRKAPDPNGGLPCYLCEQPIDTGDARHRIE